MIIKLSDNIYFDTSLSFVDQAIDCQEFVNNFTNTNQPIIEWDETNRPGIYKYISNDWIIIKNLIWNTPPPSCGVYGEEIICTGNELWHEENMIIQIKMSFENNINMLQQYPEIGMYRKQNNICKHIVI